MNRLRYALTMAITEIPHAAAVFLLLSALVAFEDVERDGATVALLGVGTLLVVVGLAELGRRGVGARGVVDRVARSHGAEATRGPALERLRPWVFPVALRPRTVRRMGPLPYGDDPRQRLDVYRSTTTNIPGPVMVYFHGGGYSTGSNRWEAKAMLHRLTTHGWLCISATYRLRPRAGFEEHLQDARAAVRWAHEHAAEYGGDPRLLVMAGSSAGAHLTSLCALTQDPDRKDRPRVDAAVCLYGYYGRYYGRGPDEASPSTPLAVDARRAPPFFIVHGDHDSYAPVADARALADHVRSESPNPTWYVELPGAQHGFDALYSWRTAATLRGIEAFLHRTLSRPDPPACARGWCRSGGWGCG